MGVNLPAWQRPKQRQTVPKRSTRVTVRHTIRRGSLAIDMKLEDREPEGNA
jgi:hypothetical protein